MLLSKIKMLVGGTVLIAYHGDLPATTKKVVSEHCSPQGKYRSATFIAHFCDMYGGSSGGLIYKFVEGQPVAMAMSVSESIRSNENRALLFGCRLQTGLRAEGVETGKNQACKVGSRDGDTLIVVETVAGDPEKDMEKVREACAKPDVSMVKIKSKDGGILTIGC